MKFYFDESGDAGSIHKNSNTNVFSVCVYKEMNESQTETFLENLKRKMNIKRRELKWYRLDKNMRDIFSENKSEIEENIYCVVVDKLKTEIYGEELVQEIIFGLIFKNKIIGKVIYDGDHLRKTMHIVSRKLKVFGMRVNFINKKTTSNKGIQVADLYAGYARENINSKKIRIIKYTK